MPEARDALLSTEEAAAELHLSPRRVRQLRQQGKLPGMRRGKRWYFTRSELERYKVDPEGISLPTAQASAPAPSGASSAISPVSIEADDSSVEPARSEVDLYRHHRNLGALGRAIRDDLLSRPLLRPSQVVEAQIRAAWEGKETPPTDPRWDIIAQHLEGAEGWQAACQLQEAWDSYYRLCASLLREVQEALYVAALPFGVNGIVCSSLEGGRGPRVLADGIPSTSVPKEYLGQALVAALVRILEKLVPSDDPAYGHFVYTSLDEAEARPFRVIAKPAEEGFVDLWWGAVRVGHVAAGMWVLGDVGLNGTGPGSLSDKLAREPMWRQVVSAFTALDVLRTSTHPRLRWLLLDERLTALIAAGRCDVCDPPATRDLAHLHLDFRGTMQGRGLPSLSTNTRYWVIRVRLENQSDKPLSFGDVYLHIVEDIPGNTGVVHSWPHIGRDTYGSRGGVPLSEEALDTLISLTQDRPVVEGALRFEDTIPFGSDPVRLSLTVKGTGPCRGKQKTWELGRFA